MGIRIGKSDGRKSDLYSLKLDSAKNPYHMRCSRTPSGDLRVGHWYNFRRRHIRAPEMQGYEVFSPMGFDSFGLPAENYAIKTGVHPTGVIYDNIETMVRQLKRIGCMYDWSRSITTSDPKYYHCDAMDLFVDVQARTCVREIGFGALVREFARTSIGP